MAKITRITERLVLVGSIYPRCETGQAMSVDDRRLVVSYDPSLQPVIVVDGGIGGSRVTVQVPDIGHIARVRVGMMVFKDWVLYPDDVTGQWGFGPPFLYQRFAVRALCDGQTLVDATICRIPPLAENVRQRVNQPFADALRPSRTPVWDEAVDEFYRGASGSTDMLMWDGAPDPRDTPPERLRDSVTPVPTVPLVSQKRPKRKFRLK